MLFSPGSHTEHGKTVVAEVGAAEDTAASEATSPSRFGCVGVGDSDGALLGLADGEVGV